jgi:hypothetical protein
MPGPGLWIIKSQQLLPAFYYNILVGYAKLAQAFSPVFQRSLTRHSQGDLSDASCPILVLDYMRLVKKSHIRTWAAGCISIEQVVGRGIILVDCFLNQAQIKYLAVKSHVVRRLGGDGGDVMKSSSLHNALLNKVR